MRYGTNNMNAYTDECTQNDGNRHLWMLVNATKCNRDYVCCKCKATHSVDSSD